MKKLLSNEYLLTLLKFIIGLVFIFAGAEKIADPESFAQSISNYKIFPIFTINLFAMTVPWLELVLGILIIFNIWIKENLTIVVTLLLFFNILVFSAVLRDLDINCGCFGTHFVEKAGYQKIGENFLLVLFSYIIYRSLPQKEIDTSKNEN